MLLSARQSSRARQPKLLQRGEEAENPIESRVVERRIAGGKHEILAHREVGEHGHALRHVGETGTRNVGRCIYLDAAAGEADRTGGGAPQSHNRAQRRRLASAVAAEQHRRLTFGHGEVDTLQNVVAADMRVHARESEQRAHAVFLMAALALPGAAPR